MDLSVHIRNSILRIKEQRPTLYQRREKEINRMIRELHEWFDWFENKKTSEYDYTEINCMKHREKRHHQEGIRQAVNIFSKEYGREFEEIIDEESQAHIFDDFGNIPFISDYQRIGFWKSVRGF